MGLRCQGQPCQLDSANIAANHAIDVDGSRPGTTISSVIYNDTNNTITLNGTNFNQIENATSDIKALLDWTKFAWDIDGNSDANDSNAATDPITFVASDITSAVVTSPTVLTITLAGGGQGKITAAAGFGADGRGASDANTADNVDIATGFIVDDTGNASVTDGATNLQPTYTDTTPPTITSLETDATAGSYKAGATINITANTSEVVLKGSTITATLNTTETVTLEAAANGQTLTGVYTVGASFNKEVLEVTAFNLVDSSGNVSSVVDKFGRNLSDTSVPTGSDALSGSAVIEIDNIPIIAGSSTLTNTAVTQNDTGNTTLDPGDAIALTFSETVDNKSAISTQIGSAPGLGTAPVAVWSNSDKTVTITLDSDADIPGDGTIALTGVSDDAGNTSDITFTLDIA